MRATTIKALARLINSQSGNAMIVVLGFMALTIPVVTGALSFAATASNASNVASTGIVSSFTAAGASDYSIFKLLYTSGFKESLVGGVPYSEILPINGEDAVISWTKRAVVGATTPPEEPVVFATTSVVDAAIAPADTPTTVTYTVEVTNISAATATVDEIRDGLPAYADYVTGTTTGATTANPTKTVHDSGQGGIAFHHLMWSIGQELAPAESLSISFDAEIDAPDGYYCNVAWANPGGQDTGTGQTARIEVGTPAMTSCIGEAFDVRKTVTPGFAASSLPTTFTYRIEVENLTAENQNLYWVVDLLPPGFTVVNGTVESNVTVHNPLESYIGDRQQARWVSGLFTPSLIEPGQIAYIQFDTIASLDAGTYENEVWVTFEAIVGTDYSSPTARVTVFDVYDIAITNGLTTSSTQVWISGDGSFTVTEWEQVQA